MKYLFIFLPIFCFGQGGDSKLYAVKFDSITTYRNFLATPNSSGFLADRFELYYGDFRLAPPKPKVVESSKYLGAYYELLENGWYKEVLPDTLPKNGEIKIKGNSVFRWSEEPKWIPCDQHIGKTESYRREKMDTSEVRLLVWTGCSLTEIRATKLTGYNLDRSNLYYDRNGNILRPTKTDYLFVYISDGKWIKPSHVIKEL
jgi:hypothetical protein